MDEQSHDTVDETSGERDSISSRTLKASFQDRLKTVGKGVAEQIKMPRMITQSWTYYAFFAIAILVLTDFLIAHIGGLLFWTEQTVYIVSITARACALFAGTLVYGWRIFSALPDFDAHRTQHAVTLGIGLISGIILSVMRFINHTTVWTFFNLIVEPLDGALIGLGISYIIYHLKRSSVSEA